MTEQFNATLAYMRKWRAHNIAKYHDATMWGERIDARMWVLHYGRIIRRMEAAL